MILRAKNLRYTYNDREVLKGVSLGVRRGEIFAVMGPSGVGKTTLLRLLSLLDKPTSGRIIFNLKSSDSNLSLRRRITMVFQEPALFNTTVWENVAYGLWVRNLRGKVMAERVESALKAVGLLDLSRRRARFLSSGEAQRVALARALAVEPEILFLDEPTANLDPRNVALIESVIKKANEEGTTIVLATHNIAQVKRLADRAALLLGKIVEIGPTDDILTNPSNEKTRAFIMGELIW
jgi:tungstate transport system ATP-binding protein